MESEREIVKSFHCFGVFKGVLLLLLALPLSAQEPGRDKLGHVRVAGVDVSGLPAEQARQRLEHRLALKLEQKLVLTDGVKRIGHKRRELGVKLAVEKMIALAKQGQKQVPLRFTVDPHEMRAALRPLEAKFSVPAREPRVIQSGTKIKIVAGQSARTLDVEATASRLAALLESKATTQTLPLVFSKKPPKRTIADLKGITGKLSHFEKAYNDGNPKRAHNIRVASSMLNGKVVPPGETFSLNEMLGERSHEHGYLTANVIANGKLAEGIGGGVSQVTGVLFNAVLLAGLPVTEYAAHSHPVAYLPVGRDATLAWNHIDLKFKNNTSAPLYIAYSAAGNKASATLYGAAVPGRKIGLSVDAKKLDDRHIVALLYRIIKRNGKVIKKEKIGTSDYKWQEDFSE